MADEASSSPSSLPLPFFRKCVRAGRNVAVLSLASPYGPMHAIRAVTDIANWPFAEDVPAPSRRAVVRAQEVILGVGPLLAGGPRKVLLAPSIRGGVVVTFILHDGKDVTVALLNNQVSVLVYGKSWTGKLQVEEMSHPEVLVRLRAIFRSDLDAASLQSATADRLV